MEDKLCEYLDLHKEELFSLLSELLKIDTQNYITYGNEEPGQRFLLDYCRQNGFDAELYYPDDVDGLLQSDGYLKNRGTDKRPNVTIKIPGKTGAKKIMLAAHMDTMPVGSEKDWSVPGLGGVIKDGKIWGRGASDDKYGIAAALFAAKALRECGIILDDDLYITSYCDEEMGGGNGALAACLKFPSDVYINLDGGAMEVWPWGIGGLSGSASLHHPETLSSASCVFEGVKYLIEEMEQFGKRRFDELKNSSVFCGTPIEKDAYRLLGVSCGKGGLDLNFADVSFTYYTLLSENEINIELSKITQNVSEYLKQKGLIFDGFKNVSRFFHPVCPETIPDDAVLFGQQLEKVTGSETVYAGGCLSDLSVFCKYGGGVAFNTGLFKNFDEYGGAHQVDEFVDCDEFLSITKALALYLTKKSYNK